MGKNPIPPEEALLDRFSLRPSIKMKLLQYIDTIIEYKNRLNLVGEHNRREIIENLLIPSIICTQLVDRKTIIDIGSGSGILGITVKIVNDNVNLIISEKNLKKIAFINEIIIKLDIKNVIILSGMLQNIENNCLQNVEQLLIRGIKLVNIYQTLLSKFPRGTNIIYFGSYDDVSQWRDRILNHIPLPGNDNRRTPIFIFSLLLG